MRNEPNDTYYELKLALREMYSAFSWLIDDLHHAGYAGRPEYRQAGGAFEALERWLDTYASPSVEAVTNGEALYPRVKTLRMTIERFLYPARETRQEINQTAMDLRVMEVLQWLNLCE